MSGGPSHVPAPGSAGMDLAIDPANRRIDIPEDIKDDGLSTLESVSLGAGAYVVTTELLGAAYSRG